MLQRGLTARPGNRAVYIQSIAYPFRSTRLGYRELRMVVGQKGECCTWALVLVSNSGKRCYILIPSLLFGRTPNYRQPKNLSEDLVFDKVQRLCSCASPGNNADRGPYFGPGGGEHGEGRWTPNRASTRPYPLLGPTRAGLGFGTWWFLASEACPV